MYRQVGIDNQFMRLAYEVAKALYLLKRYNRKALPVAVLVRHGKVVNVAAAGWGMHQAEGFCTREDIGLHDGEGYERCPYCAPGSHAERLVCEGVDAQGCDVYVYGHFYFCEPCQEALNRAGVKDWYVLDNSQMLFNKKDPGCVINKVGQFR